MKNVQRKRLMFFEMTFCISIGLCACGKGMPNARKDNIELNSAVLDDNGRDGQKPDESEFQGEENSSEQISDEMMESVELEEWKQAYLTYLDALKLADSFTYSLIYVDDDDIPELVIDTGVAAGGCLIMTFHDHDLDEWQSNRSNVTYIERGNLVCNSDGNFGHYYDQVYTIENGKWIYVGGGNYGDEPGGPTFDENGDLICVYSWNDEDVSEEEYKERFNAIYSADRAVYPQTYYILDEIDSILKTGVSKSAGHRYEFVVEDVTWEEAAMYCQEKGGYLATITSEEEMAQIRSQIIAEEKTNITFFVGAKNGFDSGFGYHWLEGGKEYDMLDHYKALFSFWLEGEPSYRGLTESGEEVVEGYVVLLFSQSDEKCYLNDVPNDILDALPSYAGKIGYICEYDS